MSHRPHILVTRPHDEAQSLASRLTTLGCDVSRAPLLDITLLPISPDAFDNVSALAITSRNALKAVARDTAILELARRLPVYCVGQATARAAQALNFTNVIVGPGHAAGLAERIADAIGTSQQVPDGRKQAHTILHPTTINRAFDLDGALAAHNVTVKTITAYEVASAKALPPPVAAALAYGELDAVILMSPRTAEIWLRLAGAALDSMHERLTSMRHICFSNAIANVIRSGGIPADCIDVAASTNIEDIVLIAGRLVERGLPE